MTITGTAKRYCTSTKRKIRWNRVFASALIPVVTVWTVQGMVKAYTKGKTNTTGIYIYVEGEESNQGNNGQTSINEVYAETTSTTTQKTIQTDNIVVNMDEVGFKLKLKSSANSMGIQGDYFSQKLNCIVSERDQQILLMLVLSEGAYEPYDTQVSVAATVLNRVLDKTDMFPDTIEEVVVQTSQFSPVIMKNPENWGGKGYNGFYLQGGKTEVFWEDYPSSVKDSVYQAVYDALDGTDPTECIGGALYYCNMNQLSYSELEYRRSIGQTKTFGQTSFYREW